MPDQGSHMLDMDEKANILLVDDRPENLVVLEAILEPLGQTLIRANSGAEALRRLLADDFALILLDVQMPGMDGFETAALIRQREKSRHIPIIFVTAINRDESYIFQGYSVGAVDYIAKPFDPIILKSKVVVFVELFHKNEQIRRQTEMIHRNELREADRRRNEKEKVRRLCEIQAAASRQRAFLRDVLSSVTGGKLRLCDTAAELPAPLAPYRKAVTLSPLSIHALRRLAEEAADAHRFPPERCHDIVTAASEAAMNAVVHAGGGAGRVHVNSDDKMQVWVQDNGQGINMETLPQATLERGFTTAGTLGHGFWLILNMVSRVWLMTGKTGTTIVLEQDREPPEPAWFK